MEVDALKAINESLIISKSIDRAAGILWLADQHTPSPLHASPAQICLDSLIVLQSSRQRGLHRIQTERSVQAVVNKTYRLTWSGELPANS